MFFGLDNKVCFYLIYRSPLFPFTSRVKFKQRTFNKT